LNVNFDPFIIKKYWWMKKPLLNQEKKK